MSKPISRSLLGISALGVLALCSLAFSVWPQEPEAVRGQMTTQERLQQSVWWPRQPVSEAYRPVDPATCGICHGEIAESQAESAMAGALAAASASPETGLVAGAAYEIGPFEYRITDGPEGLGFTVGDGTRSHQAPIQWVFGSGETGHTFLWKQDGVFYESRFSYFPALQRFDDTPGRLRGIPDSLEMALGHPLSEPEVQGCFSCHTSTLVVEGAFDPHLATPGVTCEGCHGPGAEHVELEIAGQSSFGSIFQPSELDPHAALDYCGACHSTFWDIEVKPAVGEASIRSPGYRLVQSPCWGSGDARLVCTACHDPHQPLEHEPTAYDSACLACHQPESQDPGLEAGGQQPCPVAVRGCVDCHMPKVELPELQVKTTDHFIRIVEPGAPFPG